MKIISFWLVLMLSAGSVCAQDAATQQQIDKLSGQIQDILASQERQGKQITDLQKQISDLTEKVNAPQVSESASREDLKNLAEKVQEIDKKRQADRDLIIKEIEKLGNKTSTTSNRKTPPTTAATEDPAPVGPQKGYEHKVEAGETVSDIAKAYRDQGVKVTTAQILKANPKLDPAKLYVGQKIFIPDPNAK